jgi:hypothetical protein
VPELAPVVTDNSQLPSAPADAVRVSLTIAKDLAEITASPSAKVAFERDFKAAVAAACGINEQRVLIKSIMAASVLVTMDLLASADGSGPNPAAAFASLAAARSIGGFAVEGVAGAGAVTPRACVRPAAAGYVVTEASLDAYDLQVHNPYLL